MEAANQVVRRWALQLCWPAVDTGTLLEFQSEWNAVWEQLSFLFWVRVTTGTGLLMTKVHLEYSEC
jgi:hypothetical protein